MSRLTALCTLTALATPVAAHDGMALGGALHRLLHFIGTDTVLALAGIAVALVAARLLRHGARRAGRRARR